MMIIMMTEHSSTCTAYENMLCYFLQKITTLGEKWHFKEYPKNKKDILFDKLL